MTIGAWGGFGNGQIPASSLTGADGVLLHPTAWAAYCALNDAFHAHFGKHLDVVTSYRPLAVQMDYWNQYLTGLLKALAAFPGTSNHGWGLAADFGSNVNVSTSAEFAWMRANASAFGWTWPESWARSAREFWHWEYTGPLDTPPAPSNPVNVQEDDMYDSAAEARIMARLDAIEKHSTPYREISSNGAVVLVNPANGKTWPIPSQAYADLLRAWGLSAGPLRDAGQNEFDFVAFLAGAVGESEQAALQLSADDAAKIAAAIPAPQLALTQAQLDAIVTAAKSGAQDAVKSLSFVTVAN